VGEENMQVKFKKEKNNIRPESEDKMVYNQGEIIPFATPAHHAGT
jgi:hypothetical protein